MSSRVLSLGLAAAVFIGTAACDEALSSLTGPTPNLAPTLSSIQKEIFDTTDSSGRLACTNCHNGVNPFVPGNLRAGSAYGTLVNVRSVQKPNLFRVAPGDPDNSYIIHKLEGRADIVGLRMPRGTGPFLTDGQLLVLRRWIELGAKND
jgi:hypothetical protein